MTTPTDNILLSASGIALPRHWVAVIASIWTGQAFSIISSGAAGYAIIWYVTETTGSSTMLSLMMICAMLPTGLLAPIGGLFADRYNRKMLMIAADGFVGALSAVLVLLIFLGDVPLWAIFLIAAGRSVGQAFHSPAFLALVPMLVPDKQLLRLNMLDQLVVSASQLASPAIGIFIYATFGLGWAMMLDVFGAMAGIAGLLIARVPTVRDSESESNHIFHNLTVGWRALSSNRGLFALLIVLLVQFVAISPIVAIFPLMTYDHFHGDGYMAAIVEAAYGGGLIVGSAALLIWGGGHHLARLISIAVLATGATVFICGIIPSDMYWLFVVMNVLCGLGFAGFNGPLMTLVQREVTNEKLGRAMGLINAVTGIGAPVGIAIGGPFGDVIGVPALVALCGAVSLICGIACFIPRSIRRLDK